MANWITHMIVADRLLERIPQLERNGFCVGNVAPDCNIENEDWSAFMPPREVTHWMVDGRKTEANCDRFCKERLAGRKFESMEEWSFFLGYYSHLITDSCFQRFIRDEERVRSMIGRIRASSKFSAGMMGRPDNYDVVKQVFPKSERLRDVNQLEYEYLRDNPRSCYLQVLMTLNEFPDYMDILPKGAIVRKLRVMATLPKVIVDADFVFFTRAEYRGFLAEACESVEMRLRTLMT